MKKIKLNSKKYPNKYALVDDEDFDYLSQFKWNVVKGRGNTYYAQRSIIKNGKKKSIFMHREIMNTPKNMQTDHINGSGLNNQRYNLRICTNQQNHMNQKARCDSASGYKGVGKTKYKNKWSSRIQINDKQKSLGHYNNKIDAALVYDYNANKYFGEYARLNFPNKLLTDKEYNKLVEKNYSSEFIGIYWDKSRKKWTCNITINRVGKHIGRFNNEIGAVKARDKYILDNNLDINKYKLNLSIKL